MSTLDSLHTSPAIGTTGTRRVARSIAAVLAGLFANFLVTTATDIALHAAGVFPPLDQRMPDELFLLAFAYRVVYGIAGSYVTARLAPARPVRHALALGIVGVVISTAGAIAMWDAGPAWYSLAIIAVALPCSWVGGTLRERRLNTPRPRS